MVTIIEMGTGVNAQIISTSTYWRFELWTGLLLTALIIPLSYILTVKYAIMGPAIANIISFTIYNTIRYVFLWKKFNMQPFSSKTIEVIMISGIDYLLCYLLFDKMEGLIAMILRTALFAALFIATIYWRNISPDLKPIAASLLKRVNKKKVKL